MEELQNDSSQSFFDRLKNIDFENFLYEHRVPAALSLIGLILIGFGVLYLKNSQTNDSNRIEILESKQESESNGSEVVVEVSGAVKNPGVYKLSHGSRVDDAVNTAGGFSEDVDVSWVSRFVNRAAKLSDGQKLFFPSVQKSTSDGVNQQIDETSASQIGIDQSDTSVLGSQGSAVVNINTASKKELESLWGIGPVYAQNIIDHRPYSDVAELLNNKIIKSNVYERNKGLMSAF